MPRSQLRGILVHQVFRANNVPPGGENHRREESSNLQILMLHIRLLAFVSLVSAFAIAACGSSTPNRIETNESDRLSNMVDVKLSVDETDDSAVHEVSVTVTNITGNELLLYHPAGGPVMIEVIGGLKDLLWRDTSRLGTFTVTELRIPEGESLTYTRTINTREFENPVPLVFPAWIRGSFGAALASPESQVTPTLGALDPIVIQWVESGLEYVVLNNQVPG